MEEGTINMLHRRRPKANGTIIVPRMSHPQRAPSGQDVDQQAFAAVQSFPTTAYSPNLAQGQGLYVSNSESNRFTYQRQVSDAGDASLQAQWLLFLKLQPSLCSLLGNLADWHGPQEELVRTDIVEEPSPTEHSANETEIQRQSNERERRFRYLDLCVPLYQAALKGDWLAAEALLQKYPDVVRDPITEGHMTALHIAAAAKRTDFVKELVKCMSADDLALQNKDGNTALCFAAASGIVTIAEEMVNMNNRLPCIRDSQGLTPLLIAASLGRRNMVSYLLSVTPFDQLIAIERIQLLLATISTDMYDLALKILKMDRTLATAQDGNRKTALHELAKKPFAIGSKSELSIWEACLNSCFKGFYNKALMQTFAHQLVEDLWKEVRIVPDRDFSVLVDNHASFLFDAAEVGNAEFLKILVCSYPDLMWKVDKKNRSLFHIAVLNRQESVYNLIYEIGTIKDIIAAYVDENNDNMLHLAGKLPPPDRLNILSGAALQMQRELLWFKEIEKIVPPPYVNMRNLKDETPWDIFTKRHKELRKDGEKWMKDTANYCMLVATLIATVVFAATFTVPGGNNQEKGTPIFFKKDWFMVFFMSNAIALLSSSTSILMFLSILTSRYTENDFLKSLPTRLVFGLTTLFTSIVGMVVAFSATCFLVYNGKMSKAPIVILAATGVPITSFVLLHYQLWADIILSTYWSMFLFRPPKHRRF